jgi:hypothetical protein
MCGRSVGRGSWVVVVVGTVQRRAIVRVFWCGSGELRGWMVSEGVREGWRGVRWSVCRWETDVNTWFTKT